MTVVRTVVVAVSVLSLSATSARAAGSTADTPGVKADPTAVKATATAGKAATTAIKDTIIGIWKSVDDGELMNFSADGAARVGGGTATFIGTYKFLDDGSLRIDLPAFGKQNNFVYQVEMKDAQLILTLKDRAPRKYDRVK